MAGLDKYQVYAVDTEDPMICVAGPGSGKTRVLTEKARKHFGRGDRILCLTFTRAAAREMASRVEGLPATTIHSYCCGRVGWNEKWGYTGLLYRFLMEVDDEDWDWVLVDEVQDLNELEMDVVLSLSAGGKLFAVGDPYQSIYGFQGALGPAVMGVLDKAGCGRHDLKHNYRSCEVIVDQLNTYFPRGLVSKGPKEIGSNAILCRTNDDVFLVSNYLKDNKVPHRLRLSSEFLDTKEKDILGGSTLKVSSVHQAKGTEYDKVMLFDWRPNEKGEEERVYYVAMSRASKEFIEVPTLDDLVSQAKELTKC